MNKNRTVIIADASFSMGEFMNGPTKTTVMTNIITQLTNKAKEYPEIELALRVFGNNPLIEEECNNTELEAPFFVSNSARIINAANKITPYGSSPICLSLSSVVDDFPKDTNQTKFALLIVDGTETCNGNLCETYNSLSQKEITVFVIGLNIDNTIASEYHCFPHFHNTRTDEEAIKAMESFFSLIKPY